MENNFLSTRENNDINIIQCGCEHCMKGHSFGPFIRDHHLLHYVAEGCGTYIINKKEYKVSKGQIFYIPPDIITYYVADSHDPWFYKWVGFYGIKAENFMDITGLSAENPVITCENHESIENIIDLMFSEMKNEKKSIIKITGLLYLFIDELSKNNVQKPVYKSNQQIYIENAVQYINNYIYKKITVEELAEYIGIDRSYLCSIFKKLLNASPQKYMIDVKLKKAMDYLKSTNNEIKHISKSVGYDDPLLFSRLFKKKTGVSPKEFRNN